MARVELITDWRDIYLVLREAGLSMNELAKLAGVSRAALGSVIAGVYPHYHQPKYGPGVHLLARLREVPNVLQRIDKRRVNKGGQFIPEQYAPRARDVEPAGAAD